MKIALDTNRYVDFVKGVPQALDPIQRADRIAMPLVVLAELRAGFHCGSRSSVNERTLTQFLSSPRVDVLYPDDATIHHYARVFRQLRDAGTPIPTNDIWIAALVLEHGLYLCARDKHFDCVAELARI